MNDHPLPSSPHKSPWQHVSFISKFLRRDPWRKLIALIFAILTYLAADNLLVSNGSGIYQRKITIEVPVKLNITGKGKFWYECEPGTIALPISLSMFNQKPISAADFDIATQVDLESAFASDNDAENPERTTWLTRRVQIRSTDIVRKPGGCDFSEQQLEVVVHYDKIGYKEVPVECDVESTLPRAIQTTIHLTPQSVSVSGPLYRLNQLTRVSTEKLVLSRQVEEKITFDRQLKLYIPGDNGGTISMLREYTQANVTLSRQESDGTYKVQCPVHYLFSSRMPLFISSASTFSNQMTDVEVRMPKKYRGSDLSQMMVVCDLSPYEKPGKYDVELRLVNIPSHVSEAKILPDSHRVIALQKCQDEEGK